MTSIRYDLDQTVAKKEPNNYFHWL